VTKEGELMERAVGQDGEKAAPKPLRRMLLKPREVCQLTGLGKSTVYELMAAGVIPCVRIGRCVRVPTDRLREWIEQLQGRETQGKESSKTPPKSG
jgi:excisionase family DNA binding protein